MSPIRPLLAPAIALTLAGCAPVSFVCDEDAPLCGIVEVVGQDKKTAGGISIDSIELSQAVAVPLMNNGLAVEQSVDVVAGRDTLVRVFVRPNDDYEVRDIAARMLLLDDEGEIIGAAEGVGRPVGLSTNADLDSTINIRFEAGALPEGQHPWSIELLEATPEASRVGKVDGAFFPEEPDLLPPLEVTYVGRTTRLYIIPIELTSTGDIPPTDESVVESIRTAMKGTYPVPDIEVEVGPPHPWPGNPGVLQAILQEVSGIRDAEPDRGIDPDQYVFGLVPGGGGGLSWVGGSPLDTGSRNSVGGLWTLPHEVGHAHGRLHGPCGGAANPHPDYPYENSGIGVWGWDHQTDTLYDPAVYVDLMSYCDPTWTSDFYWQQNFNKTLGMYEAYNGVAEPSGKSVERSYQELWVYDTGDVTWGRSGTWTDPYGEAKRVELLADDGRSLGMVDAVWSPMQHIEGGVLLVPDAVEFSSVRLLETDFVPVDGPVVTPVDLSQLVPGLR